MMAAPKTILVDDPTWARLRGRMAPYGGKTILQNPYKRGTGAYFKWRFGYALTLKSISSSHVKQLRALQGAGEAPRRYARNKPGRGRSTLGYRGEWSQQEIDLALAFAKPNGTLSHDRIGLALGRPRQAVANKLHRLRLQEASQRTDDEGGDNERQAAARAFLSVPVHSETMEDIRRG